VGDRREHVVDTRAVLIDHEEFETSGELGFLLRLIRPSAASVLVLDGRVLVDAATVADVVDCSDRAPVVLLVEGRAPGIDPDSDLVERGPRIAQDGEGGRLRFVRGVGGAAARPAADARFAGVALMSAEALASLRALSNDATATGLLDARASLLDGLELLRATGTPMLAIETGSGGRMVCPPDDRLSSPASRTVG
jgi:hypothetical protein